MSDLVFGTWDFKWPQGTEIRVAFQELPNEPDDLPSIDQLMQRYIRMAGLWLEQEPNIYFDFITDRRLPAPTGTSAGWRTDRKGVVREKLSARSTIPSSPPVKYDVLVSFAPLPLFVVEPDNRATAEVPGQVTVLGSYARRVEYGMPTTVVGPNVDFVPVGKSVGDYYADPVFDHVLAHEIGHVLGMAHEHQNPLYASRPAVEPVDQTITGRLSQIREVFFTKFDPQIDEEIRRPWPYAPQKTPGRIPYSDWRTLAVSANQRLENQTVMAHPIWSDLLQTPLAGKAQILPGPTAEDLDRLWNMYPRVTGTRSQEPSASPP